MAERPMAIVLDIKQILDTNTVENERIEYKEGWNPLKIIHSLWHVRQ